MCEKANKPEGLDIELYGQRCQELDWLTAEEKERLMNGEREKEMTEDGLAK
ncbi:hypothetical protein SELR_13460 [Selenomonas ruminantium subsp. lactilytica TAM6421]|uniref:Uncharacterized protein n=1 Tax=Selenomonas ruminantium subsp. lactilytica (strain NBRC 103574 / TAM6421) TaxID=927704 RepID=I0GQL7_SELRL|nr:hypothetical protein [Selenomonas ruminantium]BAL83054.1 hypothetical protein SELR_13460 [Selenomonas ruminantium subsp. lactilytica TAM6421]